jgi:hypothetical protein
MSGVWMVTVYARQRRSRQIYFALRSGGMTALGARLEAAHVDCY